MVLIFVMVSLLFQWAQSNMSTGQLKLCLPCSFSRIQLIQWTNYNQNDFYWKRQFIRSSGQMLDDKSALCIVTQWPSVPQQLAIQVASLSRMATKSSSVARSLKLLKACRPQLLLGSVTTREDRVLWTYVPNIYIAVIMLTWTYMNQTKTLLCWIQS